jgi:hypothetical protein
VTVGAGGAGAPDFTEPAPKTNPSSGGVMGEVSNVVSAAQRAVTGYFDLIVLEARRAGVSLVWMVALGFAAAILGVTAWMGLVAALAFWAVDAGLSPILAILLMVVLNLAGAGAAVFACVKRSKDLMFSASRRQLTGKAAEPPATS